MLFVTEWMGEQVSFDFDAAVKSTTKVCSKCKERLKLELFNKRSTTKDGRQAQCRACSNQSRIDWHRRDPEKARAYDRARQNTVEVKARAAVSTAVKSGRMVKPDVCTVDGCEETQDIAGHHPDYSRPLYVIWLCRQCHEDAHTAEREEMV